MEAWGGTSSLDSSIVAKLLGHRRRTLTHAYVSCGGPLGCCSCSRDGDSAGTTVARFAASETQAVYSRWDIVVPSCNPEWGGLGVGEVAGGGVWRVSGRPLRRVAVPGAPPAELLAIGGGRIALVPAAGLSYPELRVEDQTAIQLRDATGGLLRSVMVSGTPIALRLRADTLAILVQRGAQTAILIHDPDTGALIRELSFPHKPASAIARSGRWLVYAVARRVVAANLATGAGHELGTSPIGHAVAVIRVAPLS
jgi:hypothetical protein